jgi:hypothetical protein
MRINVDFTILGVKGEIITALRNDGTRYQYYFTTNNKNIRKFTTNLGKRKVNDAEIKKLEEFLNSNL